ncbi:hypothetical protein CaCOL14_002430 [Colletotrichum acutatum]
MSPAPCTASPSSPTPTGHESCRRTLRSGSTSTTWLISTT